MGFDLKKAVDIVRDDMKAVYKRDPGAIWNLPFVVMHANGETVELPMDLIADKNPEEGSAYIAGWLNHFRNKKRIEAVVVGRQVVKMGGVLDASGQPTLKEKGIMVSGYSFATKRTIVSITPTREFRDYRSTETIQKEGVLPNPGLDSPDAMKSTTNEYGETTGTMLGQFGDEDRHDSQMGERVYGDPIIMGVSDMVPPEDVPAAPVIDQPDMTVYNALKKLNIGPMGKTDK
jgi:hypothetical protein